MAEYVDTISRQAAIDALWKALYDYEDETEKQFQESDELDAGDWILHRIFVQNMSDIDRQTILALPSVQSEIVRCKDCIHYDLAKNGYNGQCNRQYATFYADDFCSYGERRGDAE